MSRSAEPSSVDAWTARPDPEGKFSSGIPGLDALLGGGYDRGSFALVHVDPTVRPADRMSFFGPVLWNFLAQSRGIIAVLPAVDTPAGFRSAMLQGVSRRRFDSRVRIVDYVGEGDQAPYVVSLPNRQRPAVSIRKMVEAEKAVMGRRGRAFLEFNAFEILEAIVGPEKATKMLLFGIKRTRSVGNLGIGLLRPGLRCADAVRSMVDLELVLHRDASGLRVSGLRPEFSERRVVPAGPLRPPRIEPP